MDKDYLAKALADEAALAELLGYHKVHIPRTQTAFTLLYSTMRGTSGALSPFPIPQYRREWNAAGKLISRFSLSLDISTDAAVAYTADREHGGRAEFAEHPDKDAAIRAAIVGAARSAAQAARSAKSH